MHGKSRGLHCDQPAPMASNSHNPAMSPQTGTFGHLSHCDNSGKKGGMVLGEGSRKNKKNTNAENNC